MAYSITPLGDSALTVSFGNTISDEINKQVMLLMQAIEKAGLPAIKDIVPAYSSVTIFYDLVAVIKMDKTRSAFRMMAERVEALLSGSTGAVPAPVRKIAVPVCYSLKYALDLVDISEQTGLSVEQIISLHTGETYKVYMIGFLPGFAYMGNVHQKIAVPRKSEPRIEIVGGSVGIAGKQTGIYPMASPGGWQIVGRTPIRLFDKEKEEPVFFRAGDEVQFYSISENEFDDY